MYVLNSTKKCRPVADVEVEIQDVRDEGAPINGQVAEEKVEQGERRAGIQAPVVQVDENSDTVKKYPKSPE